MKKIKYYTGPGGVFYNPKTNDLFTLEYHPKYIVKIVKNKSKKIGQYYYYSAKGFRNVVSAIEHFGNSIVRVGDV